MKFVLTSWRAAWIRRRAEIMLTVGMGVGFAIVYAVSKWV